MFNVWLCSTNKLNLFNTLFILKHICILAGTYNTHINDAWFYKHIFCKIYSKSCVLCYSCLPALFLSLSSPRSPINRWHNSFCSLSSIRNSLQKPFMILRHKQLSEYSAFTGHGGGGATEWGSNAWICNCTSGLAASHVAITHCSLFPALSLFCFLKQLNG